MAFIWVTCMFLGSTFDRQGTTASGQTYSVGTATFVQDSATIEGQGTTWVADMEGGLMVFDDDD